MTQKWGKNFKSDIKFVQNTPNPALFQPGKPSRFRAFFPIFVLQ